MSERIRELWERFQQLPTVYKVAIIGGLVVAAVLIYHFLKNRPAASTDSGPSTSDLTSLPSLPNVSDFASVPQVASTDTSAFQQSPIIPPVWQTGPADVTNPTRIAALAEPLNETVKPSMTKTTPGLVGISEALNERPGDTRAEQNAARYLAPATATTAPTTPRQAQLQAQQYARQSRFG